MFCPQCGTTESDDLKFCKSCGANLQAVRQVVATRETGEKSEWSTWVAEAMRVKAIVKEEQDRQRGITPEVKRLREVKAGVITASVGIALSIFLFIFMQGIVLGARIGPDVAEILSRLWVVGVIPVFVGIGLLINRLFVQTPARTPTPAYMLEKEQQQEPLRSGDAVFIPSSVTEETTRHLSGTESKE